MNNVSNNLLRISTFWIVICLAMGGSARAEGDLVAALETELTSMDCPGAVVGVAKGSEPPKVYVLGVADVDAKTPMQRDSHMRIASVTKLFLGTSVLLLADEGKLSLDDPISKYVDGVPEGDKITLRQLANNTSGLFNSIENRDFQNAIMADVKREWQPTEILEYAFAKPSYAPPGEKWRYSNTNAVLLGLMIEKVSGKPLAEFIEERVSGPLGLKETDFIVGADAPAPAPSAYRNGYPDRWIGYGQTFYNVTGYSSSWAGAAGNMYSTVDDLVKAGKSLATGGLLSDAGKKELHTWVPVPEHSLQYGFCIGEKAGWIGHTGDVPGYSSYLGYLPAKDVTIVALANLSNNKDGTSPAERLRDVVIESL